MKALPVQVAFEGENVAELLLEKKAKWHKACHLQFSQSIPTRTLEYINRKRECSRSAYTTEKKCQQRLLIQISVNSYICFYRRKDNYCGTLHQLLPNQSPPAFLDMIEVSCSSSAILRSSWSNLIVEHRCNVPDVCKQKMHTLSSRILLNCRFEEHLPSLLAILKLM